MGYYLRDWDVLFTEMNDGGEYRGTDTTAHNLLQCGYRKVTAGQLIRKQDPGPAALEPVFREEVEIALG